MSDTKEIIPPEWEQATSEQYEDDWLEHKFHMFRVIQSCDLCEQNIDVAKRQLENYNRVRYYIMNGTHTLFMYWAWRE